MNLRYRVFLLLCLFLCAAALASAQTGDAFVRAGVHISPPFVMSDETGNYTGMAVDLWDRISNALGLQTGYTGYRSVDELLKALQSSEIDIVVTNLTVTHDRAQFMQFTYPWYDAGLRIMINTDTRNSFWDEIMKAGRLNTYLLLAGALILFSLVITIIRRTLNSAFPRNWLDGFSLNFRDIISTAVSGSVPETFSRNGEKSRWFHNIITAMLTLCGVALITYITSTVTSVMTTVSLANTEIYSLTDLAGKRVGVLGGSAAEEFMQRSGFTTVAFDDIGAASHSLLEKTIFAVVADAPVVEYWSRTHPGIPVKVTGELFHPDKYAFALGKESELAGPVSVQLIKFHEDMSIPKLKYFYFGTPGADAGAPSFE
ncbi:MAG: transporter substrate-binding domain-containing protein [Spirochaetaceae bacterium]|nr:transporter substrate-binding domain-containing protein [Spirochaetaceae bacterium]